MSDVKKETVEEKVEDVTISNPDVVTKYKTAADISNRVLKKVIDAAVDGAKILDICTLGDKLIEEEVKKVYTKGKLPKGVGFPTCVSPNNVVCHFSPLPSDPEAAQTLKTGDMVKIQLGAQVDGYAAIAGHTIVIGASKDKPVTGKQADVMQAAHLAAEAAVRLIKPGHKNMEVTETVQKVTDAFGTKAVEGMLSYQQERNVLDGKKQIILNPSESQRQSFEKAEFLENEVYVVDILVSSGDGKAKQSETRTTIYKKTGSTYQLKMKASRAAYSEISTKFGGYPFSLRSMEDEKKARMGIVECANRGLVQPFDVYTEKESEYVAQYVFTVLLMPSGPLKITNSLFDAEVVKSEKSVQDEEVLKLLATSVRNKKKNKKKAAATEAAPESN
ncbi:putative proliferation-associated 2g4 [Basidiobolus meristosporus CBS 931.73]|uniref:Putative proliferation-associated 2g4 n=1 Tax=Basidiobolus meristosporus CBS 931.73 TaxID=1314790 RepID=A0A1Y1YMG1_9FUNG|nr:putative proliferation-associated 2g4 [Basidiobolus meristosporus CBS 931.73]|eukprot:ORX99181.1 putative proliferation-associated 2g4 [Basidiobolus meristosporus CBS 931.73]